MFCWRVLLHSSASSEPFLALELDFPSTGENAWFMPMEKLSMQSSNKIEATRTVPAIAVFSLS